jgi:hypothetical protein
MGLPSVKTLLEVCKTKEDAQLLRKVLECDKESELSALVTASRERLKSTSTWYSKVCYQSALLRRFQLEAANEIIGTYGVEHVRGRNRKNTSPFDYCNAGDTYATTLVYVHFHGWRVCTIGDIMERGHYD